MAPLNNSQPMLRPVPMSLFPVMGSLQEVVDYAESRLPIITKNDITILLMTYHNSLLKVVEDAKTKNP
jgi:hypothetical protein